MGFLHGYGLPIVGYIKNINQHGADFPVFVCKLHGFKFLREAPISQKEKGYLFSQVNLSDIDLIHERGDNDSQKCRNFNNHSGCGFLERIGIISHQIDNCQSGTRVYHCSRHDKNICFDVSGRIILLLESSILRE